MTQAETSTTPFAGLTPDSMLDALEHVRPNNRQGEYYVTDVPGILVSQGKEVRAVPVLKPCEALGINTLDELAVAEQEMQRLQN